MAYEDFDSFPADPSDVPNERRLAGGAFLLSLLAFLAVLPFALRDGPDWAVIPAVSFLVLAALSTAFHGIEYAVRARRADNELRMQKAREATQFAL
jgi:hypothetical protein